MLIAFLFLLIVSGCNTADYENILFSQYINIMNYDFNTEDYYSMLNNKNEEIQYNTIINIIPMADTMTDSMQDNSTDKKEREIAQKIFDKILEFTKSKNPRIAGSSIRYLSFCIDKYNDKKSLTEKILKIKSANRIVVFEQVRILSLLVDKDTKIDKKVINKFLNSKSWLISRMTYDLINATEDKDLRNDMIKKYKKTNNELENLLIIRCFEKNYGKEVFKLFKNEIINNKSKSIKKHILGILNNTNDITSVISWLNENYKKFSEEDIKNMTVNCYGSIYEDYNVELFVMLLKNGFDPYIDPYSAEDKSPNLFYYMLNNEKDYKEKISKIEDEVMARKDLKDKWISYKNSKKKK